MCFTFHVNYILYTLDLPAMSLFSNSRPVFLPLFFLFLEFFSSDRSAGEFKVIFREKLAKARFWRFYGESTRYIEITLYRAKKYNGQSIAQRPCPSDVIFPHEAYS